MDYLKKLLPFTVFLLLITVACSQPAPTPLPDATATSQAPLATAISDAPTPAEDAYPPPAADAPAEDGYPAQPTRARSIGYPAPSATTATGAYPSEEEVRGGPAGPIFEIEPVAAGDTTVQGKAPRNLQLALLNVTLGGIMLGTGASDDEGNFDIPVSSLTAGHRLGVTILAQESSQTMEDLATEYFAYRGDNFMNVPNIGIFFDTTLVTE